jgi:predicted Zn-dependent protease with MMP-like domain
MPSGSWNQAPRGTESRDVARRREWSFGVVDERDALGLERAPEPARVAGLMSDRLRFEELVAEALDSLPGWVQERLENVEVLMEERPPAGEPNLLGRYHGIPLTQRWNYAGVLPDTITLYRSTIERTARNEDDLRRVIAHTVEHEVAHFFGISDDRLRDLGAY